MALNFRNLLGEGAKLLLGGIPIVGGFLGNTAANLIEGNGGSQASGAPHSQTLSSSSPSLGSSLSSSFTPATPDLIGRGIGAIAKNAYQNALAKPPPPSSVLSPEVKALYGQLGSRLSQQLAASQNGVSPVVQSAYDQANKQGLNTLAENLNARGLLRSGLYADEAQKFLANQSAALAQAQLGQQQQAYNNAIGSLPILSTPGQLNYADLAQRAQQQNQQLSNYAPLLQGAFDALGGGIDNYFANRNTFYNPGASTVPGYQQLAQRAGRSIPRFGTRLGGF